MYLFPHSYITFSLLIGLPIAGALLNGLVCFGKPLLGARLATATVWAGLLVAIFGLITEVRFPGEGSVTEFQGDMLSWVLATLIVLVSSIVHHFSLRYMAGDRAYQRYFVCLSLVTASALLMVMTDHLGWLLFGWGTSNLLLVRLMIHKTGWGAAFNAGKLALQTFVPGFICLVLAFLILADVGKSVYLHELVQVIPGDGQSYMVLAALLLIVVAVMTQSAQIPFHQWLTSSLNSPTPVSALMHAGLVNGGGFLLARFAPLYLNYPVTLQLLFIVGSLTALVGTAWKLIQSDVKRMLACSTMGQMGFMIMQCGLGLFPAAVAHLCWHGLFKAFLFLSTGSTVQEKRQPQPKGGPLSTWLLAGVGGLVGAFGFAFLSDKSILAGDTTLLLTGFAFMATTQVAYTVLHTGRVALRLVPALLLALLAGCFYGISVHSIDLLLGPLAIWSPQPLTILHGLVFGLFFMIWLALNLDLPVVRLTSRLGRQLYVSALNGSQPHPSTTTSSRTTYHY
jgi:NAD(P)H-quinone oxidoreductase subunit 5